MSEREPKPCEVCGAEVAWYWGKDAFHGHSRTLCEPCNMKRLAAGSAAYGEAVTAWDAANQPRKDTEDKP